MVIGKSGIKIKESQKRFKPDLMLIILRIEIQEAGSSASLNARLWQKNLLKHLNEDGISDEQVIQRFDGLWMQERKVVRLLLQESSPVLDIGNRKICWRSY